MRRRYAETDATKRVCCRCTGVQANSSTMVWQRLAALRRPCRRRPYGRHRGRRPRRDVRVSLLLTHNAGKSLLQQDPVHARLDLHRPEGTLESCEGHRHRTVLRKGTFHAIPVILQGKLFAVFLAFFSSWCGSILWWVCRSVYERSRLLPLSHKKELVMKGSNTKPEKESSKFPMQC